MYTSAAAKVDQHLLALLTTKYRCKDYLLAFKRYILLSQVRSVCPLTRSGTRACPGCNLRQTSCESR